MRFLAAFVILSSLFCACLARADGCYICRDKSETYVRFKGEDTQDKRKQAEACGCNVGGYRSECYAANLKILCTVSRVDPPADARPAMCR